MTLYSSCSSHPRGSLWRGRSKHSRSECGGGQQNTCRLRRMPSFAGRHRGPPWKAPLPCDAASTRRRYAPPTSSNIVLGRRWRPARDGKEVEDTKKSCRDDGQTNSVRRPLRHDHRSSHPRAVAWLRARIWEEQALAERVRWWAAKHLPPAAHAQLRWSSPWPSVESSTAVDLNHSGSLLGRCFGSGCAKRGCYSASVTTDPGSDAQR